MIAERDAGRNGGHRDLNRATAIARMDGFSTTRTNGVASCANVITAPPA